MDYLNMRKSIVETGKELLEKELVARTWGNVSARVDENQFLITPSGLDYRQTTEEDLALINLYSGEWAGKRKPSGERGIHAAAYKIMKEVNYVIHTHQTYATALGLAGFETLEITAEEAKLLGGVELAGYGLTGTDVLIGEVSKPLLKGVQTILMVHHGVMICGKSKEEAMKKVQLLEEICRRNIRGQHEKGRIEPHLVEKKESILQELKKIYPHVDLVQTSQTLMYSFAKEPVPAQLDDVAQMVGPAIPIVDDDRKRIREAAEKSDVVLVKGVGAVIKAGTADDLEALQLLIQKAAVVYLHTRACHKEIALGELECKVMHEGYQQYAKLKEM